MYLKTKNLTVLSESAPVFQFLHDSKFMCRKCSRLYSVMTTVSKIRINRTEAWTGGSFYLLARQVIVSF